MDQEHSQDDVIDVRQLIEALGIDGACQTAEDYFAQLETSILAKPFNNINETAELLSCFAQVIQGLNLFPGLVVLDFGAGSGWISRFLTQLGLKVIALDVSHTALKMARELYERQPVFGDQPQPTFLLFDGRRIALGDGVVDRVICFDALHHSPNPGDVIRELGRVLMPGGVAAFSEPGPEHSRLRQSQAEMRMYRTIENDILIEEIWQTAQSAGFTVIKLAFFNPNLFLLPLEKFQKYVADGPGAEEYLERTRAYQQSHRIFFLYKGEPGTASDSRRQAGLLADLEVTLASARVAYGDLLHLNVVVKNVGNAIWLPTTGADESTPGAPSIFDERGNLIKENLQRGAVHLGSHLFDRQGHLLGRDYSRHLLTEDAQPVKPGDVLSLETTLASPKQGSYVLEFDLVSEWVCWFEANGSQTVRLEFDVL
jgi:2-polyprenyl-3-methyl-5-hydroxy-6-metoxy-1,4-benzoquinol methylase